MGEPKFERAESCPPHDWPTDAEAPIVSRPGRGPDAQAGRGFGQNRTIRSYVCKKCGETVESDYRPSRDWDAREESNDEDKD